MTTTTKKTWNELAEIEAAHHDRRAADFRVDAAKQLRDAADDARYEADRIGECGWKPLGDFRALSGIESARRSLDEAIRHEAAARTIREVIALATGTATA